MIVRTGFLQPKRSLLALVALLCMQGSGLFAQQAKIQGTAYDADSGEPVAFATVMLKQVEGGNPIAGTYTDEYGEFSLAGIAPGEYSFSVKAIGYEVFERKVQLQAGKTLKLDAKLSSEALQIEELVIEGKSRKERRKKSKGINALRAPVESYDAYYEQPDLNREAYSRIYENGFKAVKNEPLSTFSIDVDAASYSNSRRFLQQQQSMPPKDAVRIEEFINYFSYDYKEPEGEHPFSINMEVSECPWNKRHQLIHIGLQGKGLDASEATGSNLVFLIDVSGSMSSANKLPLLKKAFRQLVDELGPRDRVSMVVYAGAAGVVLPATAGDQKRQILSALDRLSAGGSTAGGAGIRLAYQIAEENFIEGGNNRVILATDGDFNVGQSSDADMTRLIEQKRESGVFLTTLGFGTGNYQDTKMELLADKGNGNYYYIDNLLEAQKVLSTDLQGTLFTIAKDVKLQIEFNPLHVKEYRLIGYENRLLENEDFNDDTKDAGELGARHSVTALYEIVPAKSSEKSNSGEVDPLKYQSLSPAKGAKSKEVLTVKFRYKEPDGKKSKLIEEVLADQGTSLSKSSDNFRWSAAVALFGMLLRESEYVKDGDYGMALDLAKKAQGADPNGYRAECIQLMRTAQLLSKGSSKRE